jgi:hypothetical protein
VNTIAAFARIGRRLFQALRLSKSSLAPRNHPNRLWFLQEEPFEVGRGDSFLFRSFAPPGCQAGIPALPGTVAALVEPAALVRHEANAAIAVRVCTFHDTSLGAMVGDNTMDSVAI